MARQLVHALASQSYRARGVHVMVSTAPSKAKKQVQYVHALAFQNYHARGLHVTVSTAHFHGEEANTVCACICLAELPCVWGACHGD